MEIVYKQKRITSKSKSWEACEYQNLHISGTRNSLLFKWRIWKLFSVHCEFCHNIALLSRCYYHRSSQIISDARFQLKKKTHLLFNWINFLTCMIQKIIISFDLESKNYNTNMHLQQNANRGLTQTIFYVFSNSSFFQFQFFFFFFIKSK